MKIICLGAHPDDIEIGAGATIAKLVDQGHEVFGHAFTVECEEYKDLGLHEEMKKAFNCLGISACGKVRKNYAPRDLPRQSILQQMLLIKGALNPDIVFTHSSYDTHQDHKVIHEESFRAFKHVTMYGYNMPWNKKSDNLTTYSKVSKENVLAKITAVKCYLSQQQRSIMTDEYTHALLVVNGSNIKERYAEAFETIRAIL